MNNTGKASDKIEGGTLSDAETTAVLERIGASYTLLGPAMLAALPDHARMTQVLAHALAHKRVAPEYENMLSNILAWLYVTEKLGSDLGQRALIGKALVPPAEKEESVTDHVQSEDGELIQSVFLTVALGQREDSAEACVVVQQHFHEDGCCRNVLSELTAEGIDQLITAMHTAKDRLLETKPAAGGLH